VAEASPSYNSGLSCWGTMRTAFQMELGEWLGGCMEEASPRWYVHACRMSDARLIVIITEHECLFSASAAWCGVIVNHNSLDHAQLVLTFYAMSPRQA
jgi:hypothetical protein